MEQDSPNIKMLNAFPANKILMFQAQYLLPVPMAKRSSQLTTQPILPGYERNLCLTIKGHTAVKNKGREECHLYVLSEWHDKF